MGRFNATMEFLMSQPPTAMTAAERRHRKNSMVALKRPMALWNCRLEFL